MFTILFWLTLSLAFSDWIAAEKGWHNMRWVTKPGTLIVLIAWFTQIGGWQGILVWFGLALLFSLLGDIFLHLPSGFFIPGIGAFFIAHCLYVAGFTSMPLSLTWQAIFPVTAVTGIFFVLVRQIQFGMRVQQDTSLVIPVTAYAIVISLMLLSAVSTFFCPKWQSVASILVLLGAMLFFVSDTTIAINRFVTPVSHSDLLVMITYHIGQILITTGALIQFVE